ncbi:MAG TPA: VTT domain-containing protein [Patescibacteria group bacterium]|nr:VTT domain-containing protein [Patescibacteria group bacterium]
MYTHSQLIILNLLYNYSYIILFPLVVIEGPIVTVIAGFLVSIGFMSFTPAYMTIVVGDLTGDLLYYSVGRWWFNSFIHGFLKFLKIDLGKIQKLKTVIAKHKGKVLFFGKLSHAIGAPILVSAGLAEIPIKDFLWFNFLATLPKSLILLLVGYYFGSTLANFNKYFNWTILGLVIVTGITIFSYSIISKWAKGIMDKLK